MITSYRTNPFYNAYLLLIIVIVSIRFLIHGSYKLGLQTFFTPDSGSLSILYLVIAPSFYLYYKNLVLQKKTYNPKDLKHLLFIIFLYAINTNETVSESFIFYFGRVTNFILVGAFILFYLIYIFKLLSTHIWFKKDVLINDKHFRLIKNWSIYLFTLNILGALALLASIYNEIDSKSALSGTSLAIFILLFWLFIYFKILSSPEILYGLPILNKKLLKFSSNHQENDPGSVLKNKNWVLETDSQKNNQDLKLQEKIRSHIFSYIQEIEKLSNEACIFRHPNISVSDLANKLGVPTSHLVFLFKYHSAISFSEYRMQSRIQDAISLMESGYLKTNTLESLAYKTGFASYNPFFSAFKKVTKLSPQEYLKLNKTTIAN